MSGPVRTTDMRYENTRVVGETEVHNGVTVSRAFTLDEAGTIVKLTITTTGGSTTHDGTYLVTYNGHGDALTLEKIETSGALTVANRFSYTTWGTPSVTTHDGHPDHRFRYRYVGGYGVADDTTALVSSGLLYMHARHYSPELGRFLQPHPSALETNLYAYAANSPVTRVDPDGTASWKARKGGGGLGSRGARGGGGRHKGDTKGGRHSSERASCWQGTSEDTDTIRSEWIPGLFECFAQYSTDSADWESRCGLCSGEPSGWPTKHASRLYVASPPGRQNDAAGPNPHP